VKIEDQMPRPVRRAALPDLRPARYYRILGRFHVWKRLIARLHSLRQSLLLHDASITPPLRESVFNQAALEIWLQGLRRDGFCAGLQMPEALAEDIYKHARATYCQRHAEDDEYFRIEDIRDGRTPEGAPVAIADVISPACTAVDRVTRDPLLIEIARRYLGYWPERVARRLYWSPVSELPEDARRNGGQTIDFHYDIEPKSSLYAFFYITGANRDSGAHVTVAGSHAPKPLPIRLSSAFQPETRVLERYGAENAVVIEGGPGFGFLEDPACFHKALAPRQAPRLVLQLRYS